MSEKYHKVDEVEVSYAGPAGSEVMPWSDGVVFLCPCGERQCYVSSPPHTITFDAEGVLTLDGSVGSRADESRDRAENWCHFHIKQGVPTMCSVVQCPGANL